MAQIIKHRRGQLSGIKGLAANNAELVVASGSIGNDLQGPLALAQRLPARPPAEEVLGPRRRGGSIENYLYNYLKEL